MTFFLPGDAPRETGILRVNEAGGTFWDPVSCRVSWRGAYAQGLSLDTRHIHQASSFIN